MLTTFCRGNDKNFHSWQRQSPKSGKKPVEHPDSSGHFRRFSTGLCIERLVETTECFKKVTIHRFPRKGDWFRVLK